MSLDIEPDAGTAPQWPTFPGVRVRELICLICDVTWSAAGGDCCWMCGEEGRRTAEAMPWSAMAPAIFL